MSVSEYYAQKGYFVMASISALPLGPIEQNDWEEEDMMGFKWRVIATATRRDLEAQNRELGYQHQIEPRFRFFYRIEAMD